jgi:hypothetical protein
VIPFDELRQLMPSCQVEANDPVIIAVHLALPKLSFTDRGKSHLTPLSAMETLGS